MSMKFFARANLTMKNMPTIDNRPSKSKELKNEQNLLLGSE